jgi:uncharacterized membrane protein YqjE
VDVDYEAPAAPAPGIVESVKRLLGTLVAIVHGRFELVALELQEETARLVGILIWSVAALLCATIGLSFVAVAVLLAAPAERRLLVAALLAVAFLAAAGMAVLFVRRLQRAKPRPFDASLTELERDHRRLRGGS